MKTMLLAFVGFCIFTRSAFSQGTVLFRPSTSTLVDYTFDGKTINPFPRGNPAGLLGYGQLNIAIMAAPDGTPLTLGANGLPDFTSAWAEASPTMSAIGPLAGVVPAMTLTLPASAGAPGAVDEMSIVGWVGSATNWQQASSGGASFIGFTGSTLSGGALEWEQQTGNPNEIPPSTPYLIVNGSAGYNGLVLVGVPETSSTLFLCCLGLVPLIMFSRWKRA